MKWEIEKIKSGFEEFYKTHHQYPTALEIDLFKNLPSSRQIQRRFGGLPQLRKILDLGGPEDFTKGKHSSERAHKISERAHKIEQEVYEYLVGIFRKEFVHREYFFTDDRRTRTDFFIFYNGGNFSVDVFYPGNTKNLIGCLNSKMRGYKTRTIDYPVIFLMMNRALDEEEVQRVLLNKKNKLHKNQHLMTHQQFKMFCKDKKPLKVGGR